MRISRILVMMVAIIAINIPLIHGKEVSSSDARMVARNYLRSVGCQNFQPGQLPTKIGNPCYAYLFNVMPSGFILISAEDAVPPVLAWSDHSSFPLTVMPAGLMEWLDQYRKETEWLRAHQIPADKETQKAWQTCLSGCQDHPSAPSVTIEPLITSLWGQDFPYNAACPVDSTVSPDNYYHVPAGCGAVAMGMIMNYWRFPLTGNGSHCISPAPAAYGPQCADFLNTSYEWNGMTDETNEEAIPVSTLLYHTGIAVDMNYTPAASYSMIEDIPAAMVEYFRYDQTAQYIKKSDYTSAAWQNKIRQNLSGGRPVIYCGWGPEGGHIFICDGYQDDGHYHFNWGWKGIYNGWFLLGNLNPGGQNYTNEQSAVVDIRPSPLFYPYHCNGETHVTKYLMGTLEDGSGPLNPYQNQINCSWLIKPDDSITNISLHFKKFEIGPADQVTIFDGESPNAPVLGTYTGSSVPPDMVSTGKSMLVNITSGFSTTLNGFRAEFSATPVNYCFSDTVLLASSATFSDRSGPYLYRNDSRCYWYILPIGANTITLSFTEFSTEAVNDVLNIYDLSGMTPLVSYSGTSPALPDPVTSSTGKMLLEFITSKLSRGEGWTADYSITVGSNSSQNEQLVLASPNPANGRFRLNIPQEQWDPDTRIDLFDFTGKKVFSQSIDAPSAEVNTSELCPGIYIWFVYSEKITSKGKVILE